MNFTNLFIAGVFATFILASGGAILIGYMDMYGLNSNDTVYDNFHQNYNTISAISTKMHNVETELNGTAPRAGGAIGLGFILWDVSGIIKDMIALGFQIISMPSNLLNYISEGAAHGFGLIIDLSIISSIVSLVLILLLVGYIIYVVIGRGGQGGQNAV